MISRKMGGRVGVTAWGWRVHTWLEGGERWACAPECRLVISWLVAGWDVMVVLVVTAREC